MYVIKVFLQKLQEKKIYYFQYNKQMKLFSKSKQTLENINKRSIVKKYLIGHYNPSILLLTIDLSHLSTQDYVAVRS